MDLSKIELLLTNYEKTDQAVALLKEEGQKKNIEVYVKLVSGVDHDKDKILQDIKRYMVINIPYSLMPSSIKIVDELPNSLGDKLESKELNRQAINSQNKTIKNGNYDETQLVLFDIWQSVLGISQIDINDNFIDLGGDSLKATAVLSQIKKRLKVYLTFREFFSSPKIILLDKLINEKRKI